jgi:hypothetical protein
MPARLLTATFRSADHGRLAGVWAELLGRPVVDTAAGLLLPGEDGQLGLRFVAGSTTKDGPNRLHLHLTSTTPDQQSETVATALGLGAEHLDVGQAEEDEHVVLADPDGNELCVIEAGSSFLAGCGFLGEVAGDGSRDVGVFWSRALDWPLVWDEGEETAVQSPAGGTKVAWGGLTVPAGETPERARLDLAVSAEHHVAEVERLVSLGATSLGVDEDGVAVLTDPDGVRFGLLVD